MSKNFMSPKVAEVSRASSYGAASQKSQNFFPWIEGNKDEDGSEGISFKKLARFPIIGAIGIIGSAATVILSWGILRIFSNRIITDLPEHLPKPAAWLSIVTSLNSILLNIAVSQGLAITWWYRAMKTETTVKELHSTWATGSSILEAIMSWRSLNYIGLATIIVATLPINGIAIQESITTASTWYYSGDDLQLNVASFPPANWTSAELNEDNSFQVYDVPWAHILPQVIANEAGFVTTLSNLSNCPGECYANVTAIGFQSVCKTSSVPYDLPLNKDVSSTTPAAVMFSADIVWNATSPYIIGLNTFTKRDSDCSGTYNVVNCTLTLGRSTYPIVVEFNMTANAASEDDNKTPKTAWSLDYASLWENLTTYDPDSGQVEFWNDPGSFEAYAQPTILETTTHATVFGGIAEALQGYFGSSIVYQPQNGTVDVTAFGQYAQQTQPFAEGFYANGSSNLLPNACNSTFYGFGETGSDSPIEDLLTEIRATLFYSSVLMADTYFDNFAPVTNNGTDKSMVQNSTNPDNFKLVNIYVVRWRYWAASLVVTLVVVILILPLYWGFWTLAHKASLSPLETARAFHAPVLSDLPGEMDTKTLIEHAGDRNLHTDARTPSMGVLTPRNNGTPMMGGGTPSTGVGTQFAGGSPFNVPGAAFSGPGGGAAFNNLS